MYLTLILDLSVIGRIQNPEEDREGGHSVVADAVKLNAASLTENKEVNP